MTVIHRQTLEMVRLPGRIIQKAVGADAASPSDRMTMGFARYSAESGPMAPHHHAEEIVVVLGALHGWVRFGPSPKDLSMPVPLVPGVTLHIPAGEWHVFEHAAGGHVDIIFFYAQTHDIRPDDGAPGATATRDT